MSELPRPESSREPEPVEERDSATAMSQEMLDEMDAIAEQARSARKRHASAGDAKRRGAFAERKTSRSIGVGLTIAYVIVLMPLGGYFVGRMIDREVGGNAWSSWLTVIFATLGVAFAIGILSKHQSKL